MPANVYIAKLIVLFTRQWMCKIPARHGVMLLRCGHYDVISSPFVVPYGMVHL